MAYVEVPVDLLKVKNKIAMTLYIGLVWYKANDSSHVSVRRSKLRDKFKLNTYISMYTKYLEDFIEVSNYSGKANSFRITKYKSIRQIDKSVISKIRDPYKLGVFVSLILLSNSERIIKKTRKETAEDLGISRNSLYECIKYYQELGLVSIDNETNWIVLFDPLKNGTTKDDLIQDSQIDMNNVEEARKKIANRKKLGHDE